MRTIFVFLLLFIVSTQHQLLWAYNADVHMEINNNATIVSQLELILQNHLGMKQGIETELKKGKATKNIRDWLSYGGEAEDYGKYGYGGIFDALSTRAFNHFHDPLEDWDDAGLRSLLNLSYWETYIKEPVSTLLWGLKPEEQDFFTNWTGDWSWGKAREYYNDALTGMTEEERNSNFANCFRAVGQLMHLLEDMSVPLHTRNDVHIFPIAGLGKWTYETYTAENREVLDYIPDQEGDRPDPLLLKVPSVVADPKYPNLVPVAGLFDRNAYNGSGPIPESGILGLAEYSNANFVTRDTLLTYPHPSLEDTDYDKIDWLHPELVTAEDGRIDNRIYIRKTSGERIDHLFAADYWTKDYIPNVRLIIRAFSLDKECWKEYAEKLIPKAVGYSAELLDYFFRGAIKIMNPDIGLSGFEGGFDRVTLLAENTSPEGEEMSGGTVSLVVKYRVDGEEEFRYTATLIGGDDNTIPRIAPETPDPKKLVFDLSQPIPWRASDISLYLVYKGKLGLEDGAVAVGYKPILRLETSAPDRFVYSLIDGSITPQEFTYIKAKVRNMSTDKEVGNGTLEAVAVYRNRLDYKEDLSADPPTATSRDWVWSYSTSAPIAITSLSPQEPAEFNFDFSGDPIPVGITDLYLQIILKGEIGGEALSTGVGMKDLFEPAHISVSNSTDRFYLDSVLRSADEIKGNANLLLRVDLNSNGIPNEEDEPYIDPFALSTGVAFYPVDGAPPDPENYSAIYFDMPPGGYGKFIVLSDMPEYNLLLHYEYILPYVFQTEIYSVLLPGTTNQEDDEGVFRKTEVYSFRGIIQHYQMLYAGAYPDNSNIFLAPWPEFEEAPLPIDILRP